MILGLAYKFYIKTAGRTTNIEAASQGGLRFSLFETKPIIRMAAPDGLRRKRPPTSKASEANSD